MVVVEVFNSTTIYVNCKHICISSSRFQIYINTCVHGISYKPLSISSLGFQICNSMCLCKWLQTSFFFKFKIPNLLYNICLCTYYKHLSNFSSIFQIFNNISVWCQVDNVIGARGAWMCRSLLITRTITIMNLMIISMKPCWVQLIFVFWSLKYSIIFIVFFHVLKLVFLQSTSWFYDPIDGFH